MERFELFLHICLCGKHYYRDMACADVVLDLSAQLNAVHYGHYYVRYHYVDSLLPDYFEGFLPRSGYDNVECRFQPCLYVFPDFFVVVCYQDGPALVSFRILASFFRAVGIQNVHLFRIGSVHIVRPVPRKIEFVTGICLQCLRDCHLER